MQQRHLHRAKLGRRLHDPVDGSLLVLRVRCRAAVSWCVATVATVATVLVVVVVVVVRDLLCADGAKNGCWALLAGGSLSLRSLQQVLEARTHRR